MAHKHIFNDGRETGPEIISPDDSAMHWHEINDIVTSTSPFGENHNHELDGTLSGPPIEILEILSDDDEDKTLKHENKFFSGCVTEVKQEKRNGVEVGIIEGYIATWDIDRGAWGIKDQFIKGAFLESLNDLRARNRPIRFKDHHGRTVGGFPISSVHEDERGLFGVAEINLEVQQGAEAFSLAKQGVLSDFSIGFSSIEDSEMNTEEGRIRQITKAIVWEGSIVDEPMNPEANITEVKKFGVKDIEDLDVKGIEQLLRESGVFSKTAAKYLANRLKKVEELEVPIEKDNGTSYNQEDLQDLLGELKGMSEDLNKQ